MPSVVHDYNDSYRLLIDANDTLFIARSKEDASPQLLQLWQLVERFGWHEILPTATIKVAYSVPLFFDQLSAFGFRVSHKSLP